jgi:hypothetical protein
MWLGPARALRLLLSISAAAGADPDAALERGLMAVDPVLEAAADANQLGVVGGGPVVGVCWGVLGFEAGRVLSLGCAIPL